MVFYLVVWLGFQSYVPPVQLGPFSTEKDCEVAWTQILVKDIHKDARHVCIQGIRNG